MRLTGKFLSVVMLLSAGATLAHSQVILGPPGSGSGGSGGSNGSGGSARDNDVVAHVTCMGTNGGTISVDLTGYMLDLQAPTSIGSQSSGAGAGKVTFSDVEVEVPVKEFVAAASALTSGQSFQSCELSAWHAGGLVLNFRLVRLAEVQLLGGTSNKTDAENETEPVVRLIMSYGGLQIRSGGQNTGDVSIGLSAGGASVSSGWNQVKNIQ